SLYPEPFLRFLLLERSSGSTRVDPGLRRPPVFKSRTLEIRGARCQNFAGAVTRYELPLQTRMSRHYHARPTALTRSPFLPATAAPGGTGVRLSTPEGC